MSEVESGGVVEAVVSQGSDGNEGTAEVEQTQEKSLREEVKEAARRFKLKINGNEREVDQKTLVALAQKGGAADQKFQKSAENQRRIEKLIKQAKQDPDAFIKEVLGEDAVEYSKKRLSRELENLSLTPEQKELRDYKAKVESYEAEKKANEENRQRQASDKAVAHWTKHYDTVLPEAIKSAGLPLTEDVIRHATDIMIANLEEGFDLPMEAVMDLTKDRYLTSVKKFLSSADKDKLVDLLGEDVVAKLGLASGKKTKQATKQAVQTGSQSQQREVKSEQERMAELQQRIKKWQSEQ